MILPGSYLLSILLLVLTLLCWGTWANLYKLTGKWRFELFYFDFAAGMAITALIAALTFGSLGWDGFAFTDSLQMAGKRQDLFAFLAGCVFNLGNMLLLAVVAMAGMSMAFPIVMGMGLIVTSIWGYFGDSSTSGPILAMGCVAIAAAIVFDALAFRTYWVRKLAEAPDPEQAPTIPGMKKVKAKSRRTFSYKSITLALVGGVAMGCFYPLLNLARTTENGLGPYALGFIFAAGVVFSTFVFNLFFMNLPVQGKPIEIAEYFKGKVKQHVMGLGAGAIWYVGALSSLIVAQADRAAQVAATIIVPMTQGAILIAAICGLVAWKEYAGAENRVKTFVAAMLFLLVLGVGMVSVAPMF